MTIAFMAVSFRSEKIDHAFSLVILMGQKPVMYISKSGRIQRRDHGNHFPPGVAKNTPFFHDQPANK
jgi:hypothetical protein